MKILALTYNFKPDPSPTAHCLEILLDGLSDKYEITILTSKSQKSSMLDSEVINNIRILRFLDPLAHINNTIRYKPSKNTGIKKVFWIFIKLLSSLVNRCYYYLYPDGGYFWQRNVFNKLSKDFNIEEYSTVIASTGLYSTQKLAKRLKKMNPNLKIVSYLNDPLPIDNPFIVNVKHIFDEKAISESSIRNSDVILANDIIYNKYTNELFNAYADKFHNIDIPLLKRPPQTFQHFVYKGDQRSVKILFAGSLYKEIRNPKSAIESILTISDFNTTVHLIGNINDCSDIISNLQTKFPDKIFTYGIIERELIYSAMEAADFLLNIGNNLESQVPSKIFEYMASGKPIIHFHIKEHDTSLKYLEKFKHVYMYNLNDKSTFQTMGLIKFLNEEKGIKVPYSTVKKELYANTPEYVTEQVHHVLLKLEVKNN